MTSANEGRRRPDWEYAPVARIHPPCEVPHMIDSMVRPHTHLIREDWPVFYKNAVAIHIEQYHGGNRAAD